MYIHLPGTDMNKLLMLMMSIIFTSSLYAHGNHDRKETFYSQMGISIEIKQAREFSRNLIIQFIQEGRLDKNWNDARLIEAKTQMLNGMKEWKVSYYNPQEKEDNKKTIYVFLDEYGNSVGVNFTGE